MYTRHDSSLDRSKWIFNPRLDAEAAPIAHETVPLKNLFEKEQIDCVLLKKRLHSSQVFKSANFYRNRHHVFGSQASRFQWGPTRRANFDFDGTVQRILIQI